MARSVASELQRMGIAPDVIASAKVDGKPIAKIEAASASKYGRYKSRWELLYSLELEYRRRLGVILNWDYEPIRLRLTEPGRDASGKAVRSIFYTPDFAVWLNSGHLQFVEVKGYRRIKDVNRYKLARDKYRHFEFVMVTFKGGRFEVVM